VPAGASSGPSSSGAPHPMIQKEKSETGRNNKNNFILNKRLIFRFSGIQKCKFI
jgi:hypothetical protein